MCKSRLLSRIRSRTFAGGYSRTGRAFFGSPTQQVVDAVSAHGWDRKRGQEVESFLHGAKELNIRLAKLEASRSDEVVCNLKSVIHAAYRLNKTTNFDNLFAGITDSELNPSTRSGFALRLAKLARYQECSLCLCQTATELGVFRGAEVTVVSLDEQLFSRSLTLPTGGCLSGCLSRCQTGAPIVFREDKVIAKLHTSDSKFVSTVRMLLKESRVHAEVQLLSYYELNPVPRKPRIICSSKDACYLCNLLIQLHGTFHIHKAHNYLYPSWRLLPLSSLDHVLAQLNQSLEAKIRELLQVLMNGGKSGKLMLTQNVNESTVFPFSTSLPTPASSSVMLAEASGTRAIEVRGTNEAQQGRQKAEDAITAKQLDTPSLTPTTGASDPTCPGSKTLAGNPPASHGSRPVTPESPSPESPRGSQTHIAQPKSHEEPTREVSGSLGGPTEAARVSEEHLNLTNVDGISERPKPTSEPELEQQSEQVQATGPEPDPQVASEPEPEPERDPMPDQAPNPSVSGSKREPVPAAAPAPAPTTIPLPNPHPHPTPQPTTPKTLSPQTLTRGQTLTLHLSPAYLVPIITAGPITLHPEFIHSLTASPSTPAQTKTKVKVQRLPRRRAAAFHVARPRGFIDLAKFVPEKGEEIDAGSAECVYVAYAGEVVVVDVIRETAV